MTLQRPGVAKQPFRWGGGDLGQGHRETPAKEVRVGQSRHSLRSGGGGGEDTLSNFLLVDIFLKTKFSCFYPEVVHILSSTL